MSLIKRWLEDLSVEMGFDGEINDQVLQEAADRQAMKNDALMDAAIDEQLHVTDRDTTREALYDQGLLQPEDI